MWTEPGEKDEVGVECILTGEVQGAESGGVQVLARGGSLPLPHPPRQVQQQARLHRTLHHLLAGRGPLRYCTHCQGRNLPYYHVFLILDFYIESSSS